MPAFEISVGAGINRSADKRLHVPRQSQFLRGSGAPGRNDRHRRHRHLYGFGTHRLSIRETRENAEYDGPGEDQHNCPPDKPSAFQAARQSGGAGYRRFVRQGVALCLRLHFNSPSKNYFYCRFSASVPLLRRPWTTLKTAGTKSRVETVASSNPPITARPRGAFCSPPSPSPSAMGAMPMIMANAVIKTGRKRM